MRNAALGTGALTLSTLLHAALAVLVLSLFAPRPVEQKPATSAQMSFATLSVPQSQATEALPKANPTNATAPASQGIGPRAIPQSQAIAKVPTSQPADTLGSTGLRPERVPDPASTLAPVATTGTALSQARSDPANLPSKRPNITPLASSLASAVRQAPALTTETATATATPANTLTAALTPSLAQTAPARSNAPNNTPAPQADLPTETADTVLAWSGTLSLDIPQGTLETAAALRLPATGDDDSGLRDALAKRLSDVDCARVQTVYDPETGAIDLRGHVKNDADRARLMERLSRELGGTLPLNDRLRRLDAPQCTVLVRLAEMPLPQSVEQFTNPLIIGADLQTRTYTFADGQTINFDLAGADYDGWLYLDFYDSEGQVLHLIPNDFIDPILLPAEAQLAFGDGSENDPSRGKFEMRVSPPYGQDIAVAMVANHPLFETTRSTVEPAGPYLEELAARVVELRRTRPDFKGEWVYLFVETQSGG